MSSLIEASSSSTLLTSKNDFFRKHLLFILTVGSVFMGFILGLILRSQHLDQKHIDLIGFPGEILMNMLKMAILPLIASSLITGLSRLDPKQSGKIGAYAILYYTMTMILAVATGIVLVLIIHPGDPSIKKQYGLANDNKQANVDGLAKLMDLFRNMFPENLVQATFQQIETEYVKDVIHQEGAANGSKIIMHAVHKYINGMNVLGLIIFFISMGLIMGNLGVQAKPLADLFHALDLVIIQLVGYIMWFSPIGIASLIAAKILEIDDLVKTGQMLAVYMLTVIVGLLIHVLITIPLILYFSTRKNPYKFISGLGQAIITALGTSSSAASLPVTFRCLEEVIGVNPNYTKFVLPVGAIINMDGTALYEAVATLFIAQMNDLEMSIGTVLSISLLATLASIGAATIPSAGLVTMLIVLTAVGLPTSDITLIIAVDWLLDRLRTAVNVTGDAVGCGFVEAMVERHNRSLSHPQTAQVTPADKSFLKNGELPRFTFEGEQDPLEDVNGRYNKKVEPFQLRVNDTNHANERKYD